MMIQMPEKTQEQDKQLPDELGRETQKVYKNSSHQTQGQDRNKDADGENGLEDTGRGKGKLGRSERVALTYMHYQM